MRFVNSPNICSYMVLPILLLMLGKSGSLCAGSFGQENHTIMAIRSSYLGGAEFPAPPAQWHADSKVYCYHLYYNIQPFTLIPELGLYAWLCLQWARNDEQQSKDTSYYSCVWPSSQQAMRPHRRTTNHLRYFATHLSKQWARIDEQQSKDTSYYLCVWSSSQQAMSPHRWKTNHMRHFETHLSKQWARIDEQQS